MNISELTELKAVEYLATVITSKIEIDAESNRVQTHEFAIPGGIVHIEYLATSYNDVELFSIAISIDATEEVVEFDANDFDAETMRKFENVFFQFEEETQSDFQQFSNDSSIY